MQGSATTRYLPYFVRASLTTTLLRCRNAAPVSGTSMEGSLPLWTVISSGMDRSLKESPVRWRRASEPPLLKVGKLGLPCLEEPLDEGQLPVTLVGTRRSHVELSMGGCSLQQGSG